MPAGVFGPGAQPRAGRCLVSGYLCCMRPGWQGREVAASKHCWHRNVELQLSALGSALEE